MDQNHKQELELDLIKFHECATFKGDALTPLRSEVKIIQNEQTSISESKLLAINL